MGGRKNTRKGSGRRKPDNRRNLPVWISGLVIAGLVLLISLESELSLGIPVPTWNELYETAGLTDPVQVDVDGALVAHMIDVGQGDSILVTCGEMAMLIDAGENDQGEAVLRYLSGQGISKLDYLIGTHPHSDHIGGLDTVILGMEVGEIIMPEIPDSIVPTTKTFLSVLDAAEEKGLTISTVIAGDRWTLGGAEVTVVGPVKAYDDLNNISLVLRVTYGETAMLFTGDQEAKAERDVVNSGREIRADLLKAGHHGSATSSSEEFLRAVSPKLVMISVSAGNSYGHPHAEVIQRYQSMGLPICRTDLFGSMVFYSDGKTIAPAA